MRAFQPIFRPCTAMARTPATQHRIAIPKTPALPSTQQTTAFSTTAALSARGSRNQASKDDPRVTAIRYFLTHPKVPRPLRFSRNRALRHWTIHRAWHLYLNKRRKAHELDLERQFNSMRDACEELRLMDESGLIAAPGDSAAQDDKSRGRLYRAAMMKTDIWHGVPIEYARPQTDYPSKEGWNHGWERQ
ncbi:hypothetical protein K490DRAFT_43849 [Saccharata proteae CBS 121410]|uniref:Uncharacterized protein n=1 Tax=Saccharata proteae CBS 121410 TaxID=1314787 RepID=A0A9P4LZ87_9PEZI|nr:hypothetical protein K490DRAFT_43849 [Saccharata proteae CBS 121410]